MEAKVIAVNINPDHSFSKTPVKEIKLIVGQGVEGDAHMGEKVKHRSRVRQNPDQPNLRQVHLIHKELFDELRLQGHPIEPGQIGENITTENIELLALPRGTKLKLGPEAEIEITGLRNPCQQLNDFQAGLMDKLIYKNEAGELIRKSGIMAVVTKSGKVSAGDRIRITLPQKPYKKLDRV